MEKQTLKFNWIVKFKGDETLGRLITRIFFNPVVDVFLDLSTLRNMCVC